MATRVNDVATVVDDGLSVGSAETRHDDPPYLVGIVVGPTLRVPLPVMSGNGKEDLSWKAKYEALSKRTGAMIATLNSKNSELRRQLRELHSQLLERDDQLSENETIIEKLQRQIETGSSTVEENFALMDISSIRQQSSSEEESPQGSKQRTIVSDTATAAAQE